MAREHAREHEQQVRQAVEVLERLLGATASRARERPGAPFRAPADRAREVAGRGGRAAARQDEFLERRQAVVEVVERLLERLHVRGLDRAMAGDAELAAEVEQLVLHAREAVRATSGGTPGTASTTPIALFASSTQP